MTHPAARVLAVLELLQAHGRISGTELARRLEVNARTMRRYIRTLEDIGIPITADRGRHGGYMLVTGYKLPPLMFNDDEVLAISLGLLAAQATGLARTAPAVESARAKLERVMPQTLTQRVRAVAETTAMAFGNNSMPRPQDNQALLALASAAQSRVRVRMRYETASEEETTRDVDTYGLVFREGHWYAVGYCHLRQGLRSFRLDRIRETTPLKHAFERPENFDATRHLADSIATLPRAFGVEVLLHTDLSTATSELHESLGLFEPLDESILLRARTDSIDWFARRLAGVSFTFEIREPDVLRDALRRHVRKLTGVQAGYDHG